MVDGDQLDGTGGAVTDRIQGRGTASTDKVRCSFGHGGAQPGLAVRMVVDLEDDPSASGRVPGPAHGRPDVLLEDLFHQ
jgi:hypothetical protein